MRGQGKTRGALGFALIFGRHPLYQDKGWKTCNKRKDSSYKSSYSNASTGSHNIVYEASKRAGRLKNEKQYGCLKKFMTQKADARSSATSQYNENAIEKQPSNRKPIWPFEKVCI